MRLAAPLAALAVTALAGPALAQATANAVVQADDAFGFVDGAESVGIYDATAVRGFSLEAAGNYRVNGTYFVKSSGVSNFFIESTTVRIGMNALGIDLPGPSGVVDYRLRDPRAGEPSQLTLGLDEYSQPFMDLLFKGRDGQDRFSGTLGLGVVFDNDNGQGGPSGRSMLLGGTARINLGAGKIQVFGGEYDYRRGGQFRFTLADPGVLPRPERGRRAVQDWLVESGQRRILGAVAEAPLGRDWTAGATGVFSQEDPSRGASQLFLGLTRDLSAQGLAFVSPVQEATAWSGEGRLTWRDASGNLAQRATLLVRGRLSQARFGGDRTVDLGASSLAGEVLARPAPDLSGARANAHSEVDQWGVGLSYRAEWRERLTLNAGLLQTRYEKASHTADGTRSESEASPLLYNLGGAWRLSDRLDVYGGYSRGLEEAGSAPASARNRNELLPAIQVRQAEAGLRYAVTPALRLVLAGFETEKPYAGLDPATGLYGLVGQVRHRGLEASMAGRIGESLSVVLGGYLLDPRREGAGRPSGVERVKLVANANYAAPWAPGLSLDAGVEYIGERPAGARTAGGERTMLPADIVVDAGLRYRLGKGATVRAQVLNLFDDYGYAAGSAETLSYTPPRRFRLLVTKEF